MGRGWMAVAAILVWPPPPVDPAQVGPAPEYPAPACTAAVDQHADEGAGHAVNCTQVIHNTNPPSSGTHYGTWAAYQTYAGMVPQGFLVHSLEHGAVVIGYNCPLGCDEDVAVVKAWIAKLPGDTLCAGDPPKVILSPNSELDMRWGAAAWNWTWKAPCPDTASLGKFFRDHYNQTLEASVCGGGEDLSGSGWCPAALGDHGGASPRRNRGPGWLSWRYRFEGRNLAGRKTGP